jgi:cellobiose phosphorylase
VTRYGSFDDAAREYVITRPDTPLPWINYLGTEDLFALVSNTGAGYTFYRDARLRRLIRYRYQGVPSDLGGRFLYVRDDDVGTCWSPTWQPIRVDLDRYECRHGLGYTTIASTSAGVDVETTFTIPPGTTVEAWRVRVANRRDRVARLSLVGAVEFCLWDALDDQTNYQRNLSTGEVVVGERVIHHVTEYRERRNHFASFACSEPTDGSDTQRESFLGPYRGWDRPVALERGELSGSVAHGWAPIGAHLVRLELEPGEGREVRFVLAYTENPQDAKFDPPGSTTPNVDAARPAIERAMRPGAFDEALAGLRDGWEELLSRLRVSTPNEHVDRIVNVWNQYQCMATFNLSRSASSFDVGIGRGIGFRDSAQDLLGFVHLVPDRARARVLDLAATQLPDGGAWHQFQPLTKRGNDAIGSGFNDDPLWLILAVAAYAKETGDLAILDEPVPYDNEPGTETPLEEHLERAARYTRDRLGPHGLPLIGRADWNDCLNLNAFSEEPGESFQTVEQREGGVAESVFIAGQFALASEELAVLADLRGRREDAQAHRAAADRMREAVREHGWDGGWFRRAYDHFGEPVGTAEAEEGQLWIEPQGICVMAGIGLEDGTAARALDAVAERLATPHGLVLLDPPYTRYHVELGEISSYPPGYKENGSVFSHTNPWIAVANARIGDADRAFATYLAINPSFREDRSDVHRCEPYVYAQTIGGKAAPTPGEAKNSWLTGSAAWNLVAITQWIMGVRPEHEGLRVDPVLPPAWDGFEMTRRFRGATYRISVRKQPGAAGRLSTLRVDGRDVEGVVVPAVPAGTTVTVEGTIG